MTHATWEPARPDYTFHSGQAERTEVDTRHLKNVIPILEDLRDYIRNRLTRQIDDLNKSDMLGRDPSVVFGKFPSARRAAGLHRQYETAVKGDYENVAKSLDTAIGATKEIIHNYDTTEERNHANAAAVSKAFADGTGTGGSGTGSSSSGGSDSAGSSTTDAQTGGGY